MNGLVDFASKNLFGALDGKRSHLIAELIASLLNLSNSFSLGGLDDAVGFGGGLSLGILDDREGALLTVSDDGGGARARAFSPLFAAARPSAIFFCRSSIA